MRDGWRQLANLVFILTTIDTTVVAFTPPGGERFDFSEEGNDTPIVPADYAFTIWSFIYASALAYTLRHWPTRCGKPSPHNAKTFCCAASVG